MNSALSELGRSNRAAVGAEPLAGSLPDWGSKVSNHVAWALLAYTGLQIFLTMHVLKSSSGTILPYFALVLLVAAIIPGCRWFESRWTDLPATAAGNPDLAGVFRREVALLWALALLLPVAFTGLFKLTAAIF